MNKIGVCEWSLPITGPAACKLAAEMGFDGIQLDIGPWENGFPKARPYVQKTYLEFAAQYGIEFPSIATRVTDYYSMVDEPGSRDHEIVRTGVLKAVEAAERMNIPLILVPNFEKSFIENERHFEIAAGVLQEVCRRAEGLGITIAAENTLSIAQTKKLVERVDALNFGIYYDSQNYFLANDDYPPHILEELYEYVVEVHVKDGKNKDLSGALLGTGDTGFYETIKVLKKKKYEGWIVCENYYDMSPLCGIDDDPVALIKKDIEILKAVLKTG